MRVDSHSVQPTALPKSGYFLWRKVSFDLGGRARGLVQKNISKCGRPEMSISSVLYLDKIIFVYQKSSVNVVVCEKHFFL